MDSLPSPDSVPWVAWLLLAVALIGVAVKVFRSVSRPARVFWGKVRAAIDSLAGRDAIFDSITGEEKVPALPGIGVRMAHQEQQMELLTVTVTKLVDQQAHQQMLEKRVTAVESRVQKIEDSEALRVVTHVEGAQLLKTIETAIKATPDTEAEVTED